MLDNQTLKRWLALRSAVLNASRDLNIEASKTVDELMSQPEHGKKMFVAAALADQAASLIDRAILEASAEETDDG